jgi:hypothetical protein
MQAVQCIKIGGKSRDLCPIHGPESAMVNKGRTVSHLWGAVTQMALWFYAIVHLLRLRQPLAATTHQHKNVDLNLNNTVRAAVHDFKDDKFWKCMSVPKLE